MKGIQGVSQGVDGITSTKQSTNKPPLDVSHVSIHISVRQDPKVMRDWHLQTCIFRLG